LAHVSILQKRIFKNSCLNIWYYGIAVLPLFQQKKEMAAHKAKFPKVVQTFRAKEYVLKAAKKKLKKEKITFSEKIEELLEAYIAN